MVMQLRALKTFNSRQIGLVRDGMIITVNDRYGGQLVKTGLAELAPEQDKSMPGPDKVKDNDAGNGRRGAGTNASSRTNDDETKSEPAPESGATESSSEDPPAGGRRRRSSSQPRGLRSPKRK